MFHLENRAGINISKDKLQYIELVYYNNEFILDYIDEAYFTDEIMLHEEHDVKINAVIQNAFNEITAKHRIKSKSLFISLPPSLFSMLRLPFDHTLLEQDLNIQFRWDFQKLYPHVRAEDYSLQYFEIENPVTPLPKYALVGLMPRKHLRMFRNFAQKNGYTLLGVDYAHFSCDCALFLNYQMSREGYNLSLLFDDRKLSFEVIYQGKPIYLRVCSFSNYGEIPKLIHTEFSYLQKMNIPVAQINNAFVFGDSVTPVLVDTWEKATQIKFYPVNPFKKLTISSKLAESKLLREHFFTFAAASGACYRMG